MLTYAQFLNDAAQRGELVNTFFEERLFILVDIAHAISKVLTSERIAHQLIGGLAVLIHVEEANPTYSALTRGVDIMIHANDLKAAKTLAAHHGLVHLYAEPTASIHAESKSILGREIMVIPVAELVRMKLTSFRLKDQVHVKTLDTVGLVTAEVENSLPPALHARLKYVRETE